MANAKKRRKNFKFMNFNRLDDIGLVQLNRNKEASEKFINHSVISKKRNERFVCCK